MLNHLYLKLLLIINSYMNLPILIRIWFQIVRFKDKESHQIFLEPEGRDVPEIYVQVDAYISYDFSNFYRLR